MHTELPRILVGVDFSPASDRAIGEAERIAAQMGAQIDFVHVAPLAPATPELGFPVDSSVMAESRRALESLEHTARAEGFAAKAHLAVGSPGVGLLDFVARLKPVLVVIGRHGRSAVMKLLMGSVAEDLIRHARVPVLVVPGPERVTG